MSRVVWDTAKKTGKEVRFDMFGEDTELDRSVIDKLADPLMHMVRNAVDHGIESAEQRVASGKSKAGTVKLSASQAGGNIYIHIEDDGKGLDPEKLINKAREKGIISAEQNLSDQEAYRLIFAPGFSTAQVVTDVSGRGVGMDVVRKNIESMRGKVDIQSTIGKGSVFVIELPLTLAIMEGIEASIGEEHFIIPSLSVLEFLRPSEDMILNTLDRGETLQFRGHFLPIIRLTDIYGGSSKLTNPTEAILVIVENSGKLFALMVDEVLGKLSVVIKSLGGMFQGLKGVSGCAIMPNGSVGLILDIGALVQLAKMRSDKSISIDKDSSQNEVVVH
jgi:two-component system chemotaxis sensor kinase CheA